MKNLKDQYKFTICAVMPGISKFDINDIVRIVDKGEVYSTYTQMIQAMNLDYDKWLVCKNCGITDLDCWKIAGIKYHDTVSGAIVCGIVKDNRVYLIGEPGLELQCSKFLTDELFEI